MKIFRILLALLLLNSCMEEKKPLVIGHRGAMGHETENTLASIQKALDLGVDMIEIDVFNVADDNTMVFHDETLDRLSNAGGKIEEWTYYELRKVTLDGGHKIPRLQDVLKLIDNKVRLNIELKGAGTVSRVNFITDYYIKERGWTLDNFLISSFKWDELREMRKVNASIPIAILTESDPLDAISIAKELNAEAINPNFEKLTPENNLAIQEAGFKIYPWTVNEPLERGKEVLTKVKISGGGRCNVTHAEFLPSELIKNYPRGEKELLGPFHSHSSGDTMQFFEERNVALKIEEDGRVFPVSNSSQTIIDCLLNEAKRLEVKVLKHSSVIKIDPVKVTSIKKTYETKKLLVTTGNNPKIWSLLKNLGHTIDEPTPSLFTFNIKDNRISGMQGVSTHARVSILKPNLNPKITIKLASNVRGDVLLTEEGPVLITHWGISGPAILRLSAWGAKILNEKNYKFPVRINWLPDYHEESVIDLLMEIKKIEAKKTILRTKAVEVPRRLWTSLVKASGIPQN